MEIFKILGDWTWFIIGILLLGLEILAPGAFMLWFGFAALLVGGITLIFEPEWQVQIVLFACLAAAMFATGKRFYKEASAKENKEEPPLLNQRALSYIGRVVPLSEAIDNGVGKVNIDDTLWRVRGQDCSKGAPVRIIGVDKVSLLVEPL